MKQQTSSINRGLLAVLWVVSLSGVGALMTAPQPAQAFFRNYNEAWCAQMGDGINDCSYFTWQQCRAAASGTGNFCYQNPLYVGPAETPKAKRKRYRY
jgi:hypothetical protein